jgi:hypothetical protein
VLRATLPPVFASATCNCGWVSRFWVGVLCHLNLHRLSVVVDVRWVLVVSARYLLVRAIWGGWRLTVTLPPVFVSATRNCGWVSRFWVGVCCATSICVDRERPST